jgi:hypothetical protein
MRGALVFFERSRLAASAAMTVALAALLIGEARATQVKYYGGPDESKLSMTNATAARNRFVATLTSFGTENLETLAGQTNPTLTFGATGVTGATGFASGVNSHFAYAVSGVNFLWDTEGADDWIQFSQPVTAFGSYIVQGGDGASQPPTSTPPNALTFRLQNTLLGTSKDVVIDHLGPDWPFFNVNFVGITDTDPFNRISFVESYDRDGVLWDDLIAGHVDVPDSTEVSLGIDRIGFNGPIYFEEPIGGDGLAPMVIPEPASITLLLVGGALGLWIARRRREC